MEQLVADHYKTIQIPPDVRHAMLGMLDEEFAALHASSETARLDADDTIRTEPTRSFGLLLDPATQQQALTWADPQRRAGKRPTRTLMHHDEGSSKTRGVELRGLEPLTL